MKRHFAFFPRFGIALRALAAGCAFGLVLSARAQDAFEPDDSELTAKVIGNGEVQNRAIFPVGDVDWAVFTIGAAGAVNLRVETAGPAGDTEIWLYDSRNLTKELAYNDNAAVNTRFSLITVATVAAGTYYVKVGAVAAGSTGTTVPAYTLRVTWTDRPDSFEPDNTAATARPIVNGVAQERSIHVTDDQDWATFSVGAGGATNLRIQTEGTSGDTEMWLFGPNSSTVQLAYNDDGGTGKFSLITQNSLVEGVYFIRVTSFGFGSTISAYTLRATWTERGDSFEPDDTPATAKPIANGQLQNRSLHVPGDIDWATFTVGAGGASNVRIETAGTSGDTEIWLFGPNSATAQIAYNDDAAGGKFSLITLGSLIPGTYYVKVGAFGNASTISAYTLRVSWSPGVPVPTGDNYEPDNTAATAKAIANGQTQSRSLHVPDDQDWVTFTIGVNGANNVAIETAGPSGDTEIWLYGPDSATAQLAYDDDGASGKFSRIAVGALGPGTYYVRVAAFRQGAAIPTYTLSVAWTDVIPLPPVASRLVNLSVRTNAGTGAQTTIVGFVLAGNGSSRVLLRGIGPTLGALGVTGVLADPTLQLFSGTTLLATNDNWGGVSDIAAAASAVNAFALPAESRDSALLQTLGNGAYSMQIGGGTGVVLAEAYEVGASPTVRLSNVSARSQVGTGADILIAGFVISGDGPKTVMLRAIGPALSQFGVTGVLANPRLDLFRGSTVIDGNDNWGGSAALATAFAQVGAFPLPANSLDAALRVTLQPGPYSVQVSGVGGTTGNALVEVYEVP